jgi:hypothetical protein
LNGFVYDVRDEAVALPGLRTLAIDTLMQHNQDRIQVATAMLEWVKRW